MARIVGKGARAWLLLLFAFNLIYLVYELAFNSRLVDAAVATLVRSEIFALEMEGRILSGIGLSLLLLRWVRLKKKSLLRNIAMIALAIAVGFPLMFFGQRWLVDTIVSRTTAEQRMDAQHLLLLKRGLANNALQLDGIPFDEADLESAHTRSFLSVLGLMTFVSPDFIETLKSDADQILDQVITNEANKVLPGRYEDYRELQGAVQESWSDYQDVSDEYWQAQATLNNDAEESWRELQTGLLAEWEELADERNDEDSTRQVLALRRSLNNYFQARNQCETGHFRDECLIRLEDIYREEVTQNLGRYVSPHDWCHEPEVVTTTEQQRGRFVTKRKEIQRCDDLSFDHLSQKLAAITQQAMTYEQFLTSAAVAERTRQELDEKGIQLPDSWRPDDRKTFLNAVTEGPALEVTERANAAMEEQLGYILSLDMDAEEFIASSPIQNQLHAALRPHDDEMLIPLGLDSVAFRDTFIKPQYRATAERERQRLYADTRELANGQPRAEEGKQYVRALIVPPVAMGFSLFFALANAIGLAASIPALLGRRNRWLPVMINITGLGVLIILPMINNAASTKTDTYRYFESEAERSFSPLGGLFATWVINTEPVVYPIGHLMAFFAPPLVSAQTDQVASESNQEAEKASAIQTEPELPASDTASRSGEAAEAETQPALNKAAMTEMEQPVATADVVVPETISSVAYLDITQPLAEQVDQALERQQQAVMVDLQLLSDRHWAIHRDPIITGEGTCLTNYQRAQDISSITSLQWRAARHFSCGSEAMAERPESIPTAQIFARQIERRFPSAVLWAHFQPTLHGEVNCQAVRSEADTLVGILGANRFTAVASGPEMLSCFTRHQRNYPLAYFGPEYGDAESDDSSLQHLTLKDAKRLRARAQGEAYRKHSRQFGSDALKTALKVLQSGDSVVVHHQHASPGMARTLQEAEVNHGVFGPYETLNNHAEHAVTVTRDK